MSAATPRSPALATRALRLWLRSFVPLHAAALAACLPVLACHAFLGIAESATVLVTIAYLALPATPEMLTSWPLGYPDANLRPLGPLAAMLSYAGLAAVVAGARASLQGGGGWLRSVSPGAAARASVVGLSALLVYALLAVPARVPGRILGLLVNSLVGMPLGLDDPFWYVIPVWFVTLWFFWPVLPLVAVDRMGVGQALGRALGLRWHLRLSVLALLALTAPLLLAPPRYLIAACVLKMSWTACVLAAAHERIGSPRTEQLEEVFR